MKIKKRIEVAVLNATASKDQKIQEL